MTGFGKAEAQWDRCRATVEISSVNHRYFDFHFYGPPSFAKLEYELRTLIHKQVKRGKLRCTIRVWGAQEPFSRLELHEENLAAYLDAMKHVAATYGGEVAPPSIDGLLRAPHVMIPVLDPEEEGRYTEDLRALVSKALDGLMQMREREGEMISSDVRDRAERMIVLRGRIADAAPAVKDSFRKRLRDRIREWEVEQHVPPERFQAELLLFCERADVTEELVRIESHLAQVEDALGKGGQIGRRLAFLCQELNREINTVGSKANDAAIAADVVSFKEELGRVREQIENLE